MSRQCADQRCEHGPGHALQRLAADCTPERVVRRQRPVLGAYAASDNLIIQDVAAWLDWTMTAWLV
ncbi:hypothetical protein Tdes44962_MAKER03120 [Teratosphaeria destructans]|uniref:Uncharacterized protein n=1 Tax=Teratosphaeria destructans TaxID=418781 RepID=A0A9W7SR33_9PEZI|nr:hypothetical protein Tdes44962_MAKER03120 [Teratosphaeria destructans]